MMKFNFQVPIKEMDNPEGELEKEFIIEGVAINATTTSNNNKYLEDELKASANTLTGVPLLKNHNNDVDSIMGRVKEGKYTNKKVEFRAKVIDKTMQEMIKDGRLDSVSVGAIVERIEEDEDGSYIARGITFKELSLVAVGADEGATFGLALSEAYKLTTDTTEKKVGTIKKNEQVDEEAPETVTKEELTATVAKAVAEALAKADETRKKEESEKAKLAAIEKEAKDKKESAEKAEAEKLAKEAKEKEEADLKAAKEKAQKEADAKAEAEKEDAEDEDDAPEEKDSGIHTLIESPGSLRGGALTIERR